MLQTLYNAVVSIITVATVAVTIMPKLPSHRWWIRAWDFPRVQIAIFIAVVLPLTFFVSGWAGWLCLVFLAGCLLYQCWRILPYTFLVPVEMRKVPHSDGGSQVVILSSNVEMGNDQYDDVRRVITDNDPDILFLMETDQHWYDAVRDLVESYPTVVTEIRDNYYGFIFATRLETARAEVAYLTPDDTPSLFCELKAPTGQMFRFIGLHPRPPVPGNTTKERDAEMLYAARFAHQTGMPVIAIGDFNDAAWSDTSRRFKSVGGYLDPRVGRGMVASFHVKSRILRTPIDQFYATPDIALCDFARGPDVGSDHFPLIARIDLDAETARKANKMPIDVKPEEKDRIDAIYESYARKLEEREGVR